MALSITDLKKGTIFQLDGTPYRVMEYSQKVMGRGGSTVNVKIKSLIDGKLLAKTFHGSDQVDSADVISRNVQYLYAELPIRKMPSKATRVARLLKTQL
jgi:elongation factor P